MICYFYFIIILILCLFIYNIIIKYFHIYIYYFYLKNVSRHISIYKGQFFINNFKKIITPFYYGNIDTYNKSININRNCKNEYTLLDKKLNSDMIQKLKKPFPSKQTLDKILEKVIKYINLDGQNIDINDLIYLDVLNVSGNYFPFFHTDVQWGTFTENHGFQIWILLEEDYKIKPRGNMFILETDHVKPSKVISIQNNNVEIQENGDGIIKGTILKKYKNLGEINPRIKYLNSKIGQIFLMNPSVYHCSDPFLKYSSRRAINIRVLYKPNKKLKIFSFNNKYTKLLLQKHNFIYKKNYYYISDENKNIKYKFM